MPSNYAHYRFGKAVTAMLPPQVQRSVRQFRRMYDMGLHGPDIFFYHNILFRDQTVALGKKTHTLSGEAFFVPVCKQFRLEPNEAAMAYLYGVLAHYCLDSAAHPYVLEKVAEGKVSHSEMETEFDRYLLQLDGNRQPNTYDGSGHMTLTGGECETVSRFYDTTASAVRTSVKGMAFLVKFLAMPNGNFRRFAEKCAGNKFRQHFMTRTPNKNCDGLNEPLLECYQRAMDAFPAMVEAFTAHLEEETPLGDLFQATFNG